MGMGDGVQLELTGGPTHLTDGPTELISWTGLDCCQLVGLSILATVKYLAVQLLSASYQELYSDGFDD